MQQKETIHKDMTIPKKNYIGMISDDISEYFECCGRNNQFHRTCK